MVFLLPAVHAAGTGSVVLSTISSTGGVPTENFGVTTLAVGKSLTITGSGFGSNLPIEIYSTVGTSSVSWFTTNTGTLVQPNNCGNAFASNYGGIGSGNSFFTGTGATACLTTLANGFFKTTVTVPALPGGAETIIVSDGTNSVSTPFTIAPSITFTATSNSFGFPEQGVTGSFTATGFAANELVTVSTGAFSAQTTPSCTTGSTLTGGSTAASWGTQKLVAGTSAGTCTFSLQAGTTVADTTMGSKSISATGGTSAITATGSFTVNPWVAFYNPAHPSTTTFSFLGNAPTSLLIEGHGFASGTIAANSITVGGVATNQAQITVGASGAFASAQVAPTSNVPFGLAPVVISGNTFSYANGNIATGISALGTTGNDWGGVLISSIVGTSSTTGIATLDGSSYKPGESVTASTSSSKPLASQMGAFGYGFLSSAGVITVGQGANAFTYNNNPASNIPAACAVVNTFCFFGGNGGTAGTSATATSDVNGAFFAIAELADTPWSTAGSPSTAATYQPTFAQAAGPTVINPSFGITPWMTGASSTIQFNTMNFQITGHGFGATDILSAAIGGTGLSNGAGSCSAGVTATVMAANGVEGLNSVQPGACTTALAGAGLLEVPDQGGVQNVVLTGSISGASTTTTTTYDPTSLGTAACTATCSLNIQAGTGGTTTILRTGTNYGVHGLTPNTGYTIAWNPVAPGTSPTAANEIGTFTSTATGGIPVPGVQVTVPADVSGFHAIDIMPTSALAAGTSDIYGNTLTGDYSDSDAGLGGGIVGATQYGDQLFLESTSLTASPTVANVGGSIGITGTGLASNTLYDLGVSIAGTGGGAATSANPPSTCAIGAAPAASAPPTSIAGFFTSSSTGSVPASTSLKIIDMPTIKGLEQGTLYCVFAQTGPAFGTAVATGVAQFELQASEAVNSTSAPIGHNVVLNAHALAANGGYNVIFAPYTTANGVVIGTVVGAILANPQGAGSGTFTVPSTIQTATGAQAVSSGQSYVVELQSPGAGTVAIASPVTLTIGSTSSTTCNTTTCVTAAPSTTTVINNQKTISTIFTNNSNAPVTAIVYAVVHNSAGQTVAYDTATITAASGASATAYNVLYGLAPGTYTVTVFATSTSGTAISATSTVTVTSP